MPEKARNSSSCPVFGATTDRTDFGKTMYAIIRQGGHQYRAEPGKTLRIQSLDVQPGETVTFDEVLLGADGETIKVGAPMLSGASVSAEVVRHGRGEKIIIF